MLWLIYAYFAFPGRVLVTAEDESGRRLDYFVAPEDAPIVDAVFAGNAARVEQLLESGANPNAVMEELGFGDTVEYWQRPIHWAAEKGNCRVLQALIKAGADANARDSCRVTPLINLAELLCGGSLDLRRRSLPCRGRPGRFRFGRLRPAAFGSYRGQ